LRPSKGTGRGTAWVYILRCSDSTYYVGSTTNLELRVAEHQQGLGPKYTADRRPVELVFACEFASIEEAYQRENQIKRWRREKKEAVIRGEWESLPWLALRPDQRAAQAWPPGLRGPQATPSPDYREGGANVP
jgi:predicted GIY-YIG superfamily endonuclease